MTDKFTRYARLTKVDAVNRTVSGVMVSEMPDRAGEQFDYDSSKVYFQQWTDTVAKATDGKSVGNVREMHGNSAAGKLTSIMFDDEAKSIEITAKVVDDEAWKKCQEGVYAGFSMGGAYVKRWKDGDVTKYTAKPHEVSLVDLPCVPDALFSVDKSAATFDLTKSDGSHELRKFVTTGTGDNKAQEGAGAATVPVVPTHNDEVVKAFGEGGVPADVDVNTAARAVVLFKRGDKSDAGKLVQAAAAVIGKAAPSRAATCEPLQKGLYTVRSLCDVLLNLSWVTTDAAYEAASEGDNSPIPGELRAIMQQLGEQLVAMTREEVDELVNAAQKTVAGDLFKNAPTELRKVITDVEDAAGPLRKAYGMPQATVADLFKRAAEHHEVLLAVAKAVDLPSGAPLSDLPGLAAPIDESTEVAGLNKVVNEATDALRKVAAERDGLQKKVGELEAALKTANASPVTEPRAPHLRVVDKADEVTVNKAVEGGDVKPVQKVDGTGVDELATAIKKAQAGQPTYVVR